MTAEGMTFRDEEIDGALGDLAGPYRRARRAAYGPAEFVDQHGFMRAGDIHALAVRAGITTDTTVLDLCCGTGGPGRLITRRLGCQLVGVDASASAVETARGLVGDLSCRYEVGQVPHLPRGPFDVVLLLETMLAFRDKRALLHAVRSALVQGGRFACTVEEGVPLTEAERRLMPAWETVWPISLRELHEHLEAAGLRTAWRQDVTAAHRRVVDALLVQLAAHAPAVAEEIGGPRFEALLTSHRLWSQWLHTGRIRKFALVASAQRGKRPASG
ncbi:MAG TPA: class I SAM-dependent methyltransferase [Ornithinicoccus sp.]|nr:class I SAM-dependent methyltransferase [Ornithinicoccus sp.]